MSERTIPTDGAARRSFGPLVYRLKIAFHEPTAIVGILALLLFTYLIVVPIVSLLGDAFLVQAGDEIRAGQDYGIFTMMYVVRVFSGPVARDIFWLPLLHTVEVAAGAIVLSMVIGCAMGWLVSRTDMFGRKWFATALIVPYMLPAWTFALAWMTLFRNRTIGGQQGWLEILGFEPPDWLAYGRLPIIIMLALHYAPFVTLLFGNALRNLDAQLEDSARILGANRWTVMTKITLPLMRPALLSGATLILAKCIGDFGVAYVLGVPVGYDVLATSLYRAISSSQSGSAAVLAIAIVVIGAIAVLVEARMLREARRFVTIGGKGAMDRRVGLRHWRLPAAAIAGLVFALSVVVPVLTLFLSSVMRTPGLFALNNFTLDFWIGQDLTTVGLKQGILLTPDLWRAAWNTLWMVATAAIVAGSLGLLVGYVVVRSPVRLVGTLLRHITFLPYLVPGIAFAVAYLSLFAVPRGPIPALYGTASILVLALIAEQMPFASRAGISAMTQLGKEPEEAAQIMGAGWLTRMWRVVMPIQKNALTSGILLPFISGIKGLSLVVILAVPGTDLLTTYSLRLADFGFVQAANAVVLVLVAVAYLATLLGQRITGSGLASGLGG